MSVASNRRARHHVNESMRRLTDLVNTTIALTKVRLTGSFGRASRSLEEPEDFGYSSKTGRDLWAAPTPTQ